MRRADFLRAAADAALAVLPPRLARRLRPAESITPQRLRALLREGAVQVVDVRDAGAFTGEAGHLACAINIPLGDLAARLGELEPWREGGLVLMCRTQVRSRQAARLLSGHGFRGLRIAHGGVNAWREAGYQVAFGDTTAATCGARDEHADGGWMPESCRACAMHARLSQPATPHPG